MISKSKPEGKDIGVNDKNSIKRLFFSHKFHLCMPIMGKCRSWRHASIIAYYLKYFRRVGKIYDHYQRICRPFCSVIIILHEHTWMKPKITRTIFRHREKLSIQTPAHRKDGKHFKSSFGRFWVQRLSSEMAWCWFVFFSKSGEIHPRLSSMGVLPWEIYS